MHIYIKRVRYSKEAYREREMASKHISCQHDMTKTKAHQSKDEVEGGVVADIVVVDSLSVLKLLSAKDDALLLGWDALLCVAKERKSSSKSV